jgi:hypothetical protein
MPRRPNIEPSIALQLWLPESLRARLDIHLWSEVEGGVPRGAYQRFFIERLKSYFSEQDKLMAEKQHE